MLGDHDVSMNVGQLDKYPILVEDIDNRGGYTCMGRQSIRISN